MNNHSFTINVGDILQNSSNKDAIAFKNKFSTSLPQLIEPGISCDIIIQGMDRRSLLLYIENAKATISGVCDKCSKSYKYIACFPKKQIKCFFDRGSFEEEEDILYIDPKESTINIEQFLVESFILHDSVVSLCQVCEKKPHENDEETYI